LVPNWSRGAHRLGSARGSLLGVDGPFNSVGFYLDGNVALRIIACGCSTEKSH
jgi:hypothetical protein